MPAALAVTSTLAVLPPAFVGKIVDSLQRHDASSTFHFLILYIAVALGSAGITLVTSYVSRLQREVLVRNLRLGLLARLNSARFDALEKLTLGEIGNRITADVQGLSTQLEYTVLPAISSICLLASTVFAMLHVDARLALIALIASMLNMLPQQFARKTLVRFQKSRSEAGDRFYEAVTEGGTLASLALFKNEAAASQRSDFLASLTKMMQDLSLGQGVVGAKVGLLSSLLGIIGPTAILSIGAYLATHGKISAGAIVALLIYQSRISSPVAALTQIQLAFANLGITAQRLFDVAGLPEETGGTRDFVPGALRLESVSFTKQRRTILDQLTLSVPQGLHVALIGPSGAGKSSLSKLLLRFFDADSGHISIGNIAIAEFTLSSLRASVCVVPQDPLVFDATLRENILFSNPSARPDAIQRVISLCRLDTVVAGLEHGLDTRLGQRGGRLSGGERQRICLARALLQDPHLLVLDEALSGLDLELERAILTDLRALYAGRTLIAITHRLGSISDFDAIVLLRDGTIAAMGDHQRLRSVDSWYKQNTETFADPLTPSLS